MPFTSGGAGGGGGAVTSVQITGDVGATGALAGAVNIAIIGGTNADTSVAGSTLTVNATAGAAHPVTTQTGPVTYSTTTADYFIICDVSGGDVTVNLPAVVAGDAGQTWAVIDNGSAGTNSIVLDANAVGGTTISGGPTPASNTLTFSTPSGALNVMTDGSTYFVY
jgi:hypothetical protein